MGTGNCSRWWKRLSTYCVQACARPWGTAQCKVNGLGLMGLTFRQERNNKQNKSMKMSRKGLEARG